MGIADHATILSKRVQELIQENIKERLTYHRDSYGLPIETIPKQRYIQVYIKAKVD